MKYIHKISIIIARNKECDLRRDFRQAKNYCHCNSKQEANDNYGSEVVECKLPCLRKAVVQERKTVSWTCL